MVLLLLLLVLGPLLLLLLKLKRYSEASCSSVKMNLPSCSSHLSGAAARTLKEGLVSCWKIVAKNLIIVNLVGAVLATILVTLVAISNAPAGNESIERTSST